MKTITAILEADVDGTLHLPLPMELRRGKVRVEAKLEVVEAPDEEQRKQELRAIMERIRARNPFKEIADPMAWQQEMRADVVLPGRA
jgi:hypothetical protein